MAEHTDNAEHIDLEKMFSSNHGVYVLKVRGDAMIEDHLCDGDYIVIERRQNARDGDQVVATIPVDAAGLEKMATLRRHYTEPDGRIRLQPANKKMEPTILPATSVKIVGIVIGVLRSYQ